MAGRVLLLATLETKEAEHGFLRDRLAELGAATETIDVSLGAAGASWGPARKMEALDAAAADAAARLDALDPAGCVAVGVGGGTGAAVILRALRALPPLAPKILISPLPFDPRPWIADSAVVLVPTLEDVCGLSPGFRRVAADVARMAAALAGQPAPAAGAKALAVSVLGVTAGAGDRLLARLRDAGRPAVAYHANGYGGAAFARAVADGGVDAVVDLTTHELTRLLLGGDHALPAARFAAAAAAGLPQVVLPGGLNFIGLNDYASVGEEHRARPHYRHSRVATHVAVTADEMALLAAALAQSLRAGPGPAALIVPLGGFSSQDAPGGAIEDPGLRAAFRDAAAAGLAGGGVELVETPAHINDPEVTELIAGRLAAYNCLAAA